MSNCDKEHDQFSTNRSLYKGILILIFLSNWSCGPSQIAEQKYRDLQTRLTDEAISNSQALTELNKVCTSIQLPERFEFVAKGGIDDIKTSLAYDYRSEADFGNFRNIVESYFRNEGWSENDLSHRYPPQLEFTNGKYRVVATHQEKFSLSNYSIYCEILK